MDGIVPLLSERRYAKGSTIFARGDSGDALFIVKEGMVKLISHSGRGMETILHLLPPGSIFGEILFSEEKRAFTALAGKESVVAALPKHALTHLLTSIPMFSMNFIRVLSQRLAKVEKEHAGFGHTWSYHRLAKTLLRLAKEQGVQTPKGTAIAYRLTHEELANLIGTTRETVTTQMGRFRKMGMVHREGNTLHLKISRLEMFVREETAPAGRPETTIRRRSSK